MKLKTTLVYALVMLAAMIPASQAATTGRTETTSLSGTEKVLSDTEGANTFIQVATLRDAMVLTGGLTVTGSTAWDFSGGSGAFKTSTGVNVFGGSSHSFAAELLPATNDGAALGDGTHSFSDLFLASGGTININNGNWVATHSSGLLTVDTGDFRVTTAGTNTASVVTVGATQTLTNKTLTNPVIGGLTATGSAQIDFSSSTGLFKTSSGNNVFSGAAHIFGNVLYPATDDGAALGNSTHGFSDLFLASGGTININNGNWLATHTSGILTVGTGDLRVTTAGTNTASVATVGGTQTLTNKTLTTPVLGAATATSLNGLTITTSTGTLTVANGKTVTQSNTLTYSGTDGSSVAFGSGGTVAYAANNLSVFAATTSAQLAGIISDETGSGAAVFANSPTLVTPVLGVATATSLNGLTITSSTGTFTLANSKTLTVNNTLTLAGTDGSSVAFGSGGTVAYAANNLSVFAATMSAQLAGIISDETGSGAAVFANSPTLVTPVLGVATATSLNGLTITSSTGTLTVANGKTLTASNTLTFTGTDSSSVNFGSGGTVAYAANNLSVFASTTSAQLAGVLSDETGTGAAVFANTPTLVTPVIGAATGTSLAVTGAVTSSGTAGIGYAAGAGGTVTQATSRTTGVTLSKVTGQITTNTTSLAAGASAEFTVTNTLVAATDVVYLSIKTGTTTNLTKVSVSAVAAGSFNVLVTNNHASTAEVGAIVINFVVIKGQSN